MEVTGVSLRLGCFGFCIADRVCCMSIKLNAHHGPNMHACICQWIVLGCGSASFRIIIKPRVYETLESILNTLEYVMQGLIFPKYLSHLLRNSDDWLFRDINRCDSVKYQPITMISGNRDSASSGWSCPFRLRAMRPKLLRSQCSPRVQRARPASHTSE